MEERTIEGRDEVGQHAEACARARCAQVQCNEQGGNVMNRPDGGEPTASQKIYSVWWENGRLTFLDQTRLPEEVVREEQTSAEQVWDSIKRLKVRGAPAIGIAGAYGLYLGARGLKELPVERLLARVEEIAAYLDGARPTAVNLSWALKRMVRRAKGSGEHGDETPAILEHLREEAEAIHREDMELCRGIGEAGLPLIREGAGVLTHCNAGALATSILGTATAPLYLAHEKGVSFRVYADETRPLLQGARLTAWELMEAGVDVTLICDDMAASLMASGRVDLVIVGTDRVAANGDVANKIGTLGVALLARHYHIPFYVACPSTTVDLATPSGEQIPIEERDPEEVRFFGARRTGPEGVKVWNPAFDVTPHELVTGIITERGILGPPYERSLRSHP